MNNVIPLQSYLDDPSLPEVRLAVDTAFLEPHFQRKLKSLTEHNRKLHIDNCRVIRHKPGKRCVLQYDVTVSNDADERKRHRLVGKIRSRRFGKSGLRRLQELWRAGFDSGNVQVPEPIGMISACHMWLQRFVPGLSFSEMLTTLLESTERSELQRNAEWVARGAWKLHDSDIVFPTRHGVDRELAILFERVPTIIPANRHLAHSIEQILDGCLELAVDARLDQRPLVPIHRDFYPDQVICGSENIVLLDFDLACQGDAALDIGNFVGHLSEFALRQIGDIRALQFIERTIVAEYLGLNGCCSVDAIRAYKTLTLVRHIFLSTLFEERRMTTTTLIEQCANRLACHRTGSFGEEI